MNEGLIAIDEAVPPAQDIALQPPLHGVLAEHLHNPAAQGQFAAVGILRKVLSQPDFLGDLVDCFKLVGLGLVRPEDPEVLQVRPHHLPQQDAQGGDVPGHGLAGARHLDGELAEVRHIQGPPQKSPVGHGVGAHAPVPLGGQGL